MEVQISTRMGTFEGDNVWIFPHTADSGPDIGIVPHAVNQRSSWLAVEALECHVKFSG